MYLAAYTSPLIGKAGYCWVWRHPVLNEALCSACYAQLEKPTDIALWSEQRFQAGFFKYDQNWLVLYRFLNAGRDSFGRLGRFFLVVGFVKREEMTPFSLQKILHSPSFSTIAENAPNEQSLEIPNFANTGTEHEDLRESVSQQSLGLRGWNEIDRAAIHCAGGGRPFHITIVGKGDAVSGNVTVGRPGQPKPRPQTEFQTPKQSKSEGRTSALFSKTFIIKIAFLLFLLVLTMALITTWMVSKFFAKSHVPPNAVPQQVQPSNTAPSIQTIPKQVEVNKN